MSQMVSGHDWVQVGPAKEFILHIPASAKPPPQYNWKCSRCGREVVKRDQPWWGMRVQVGQERLTCEEYVAYKVHDS